MPTIAAIIPTFNRADYLGACLDSILSGTRPPDRVIVVDDGSTDGTAAVLDAWHDRVEVIVKENGGKSSALNLALERVNEDYVWICDDDDLACSDGLASLAAALDAAPDAPFAYGRFEWFYEKDGRLHFHPHENYGRMEEPSYFLNALEEMFAFQFAMLVRRSAYVTLGPFRMDMYRSQDFEMLTRLTRLGDPVFVPHVIFHQRKHEGARGPAGVTISAADTYRKSIQYGGRILREYRDTLPIEAFTPGFARTWSDRRDRAAHLQRGLTFAKRAMWPDALADLEAAAAIGGASLPTEHERELPRRILRGQMPWIMLAEQPELMARLHMLTCNDYGRMIVRALAEAAKIRTIRALRQRHLRDLLLAGRFAIRLALISRTR